MQTNFLLLFIIQHNLIHYGPSTPFERVSGGFRKNFHPLSHQRVFGLFVLFTFLASHWDILGCMWSCIHAVCTHWNANQLDNVWFCWISCLGPETVEWPLGCICSCCHGQCFLPKPWTLCVYSRPTSPWVCFVWCEIVFRVCRLLFSVDVVICHICRFIVIFSKEAYLFF